MAEITIPANDAYQQSTATGGETTIAYDFPIFDDDHIVLVRTRSGVTTTLTKTTDYTVSGVGDVSGGTLTLAGSATPATAGDIYTRFRQVPKERLNDYSTTGDFNATSVNRDFDLLVMMVQEAAREIDRSLRLKDEDTSTVPLEIPVKADRASKFLGFDADGDPIAGGLTDGEVIVSAFMETLLDDTTAAAARQTLGLIIGTDVQAFSAAALFSNVSAQLSKGFHTTEHPYGEIAASGTLTVDLREEALATASLPAAGSSSHTIAPDASRFSIQHILLTNGAGGSYTLVTSGFDKVFGSFDGAADKVHDLTAKMYSTHSVLVISKVA